MSERGGQPGNQNAAKSRDFEQAIRKACKQEDYKRVHAGVQKLLDEVEKGEQWALLLIRDTFDGKPKQSVELSEDKDAPLGAMLARTAELIAKIKVDNDIAQTLTQAGSD